MTSATTGWAYDTTSYSVVRTTDGGHHWRRATPPTELAAFGPPPVAFEDDHRAWVVGPPTGGDPTMGPAPIFRTADGGKTWQQGGTIPVVSEATQIDVLDDQHAWVGAFGDCTGSQCMDEPITISQTVDGGTHWSVVMDRQLSGGTTGALPLTCLKSAPSFLTASIGWVTAECRSGLPFLFMTSDGGKTWRRQSLPPPSGMAASRLRDCYCDLYPPIFQSSDDGVLAVVVFNDASGSSATSVVYTTSDQGATWMPRAAPASSFILPPTFVSANDGWVADNTAVYATHDGAKSWTQVSKIPMTGTTIQFVDLQHGFAATLGDTRSFLFATHDGGQTWMSIDATLL